MCDRNKILANNALIMNVNEFLIREENSEGEKQTKKASVAITFALLCTYCCS